jgi:hypothetical protein
MSLELCCFKRYCSFPDLFSTMCVAMIALKLSTRLYIYNLQIKCKDGGYRLILGRVMPLELNHFKGCYNLHIFAVYRTCFPQCVQLLHLNFVHVFISIRFKIKLRDDQINSREIVSWDFNYIR